MTTPDEQLFHPMTRKEFIALLGDPREHAARQQEFRRAMQWTFGRGRELAQLYPEMWIAVSGDGVVASNTDSAALHEEVASLGLDHGRLYYCYPSLADKLLIL